MIASAPAWAVWLALGLWAAAIVAGVVAFIMARRLWREVGPALAPLLSMFVGGHGAQGDPATLDPVHDLDTGAGHETPADVLPDGWREVTPVPPDANELGGLL